MTDAADLKFIPSDLHVSLVDRFISAGLAGKTNKDKARADMIVECVQDMLEPIKLCYRENSEEKKVRKLERKAIFFFSFCKFKPNGILTQL